MGRNIFFVPPYQKGSSFEDILNCIKYCIKKENLDIEIFGDFEPKESKISTNLFDGEDECIRYMTFFTELCAQENVDKILFLDFFSPGIDFLEYMTEIRNKHIKKGALMHGGTFLKHDLYKWDRLKKSEELWFHIFDTIYVPSTHLQKLIPLKYNKKIKKFARGMDIFESKKTKNHKFDVIFPHRLAEDKGIKDLISIVKELPQVSFGITSCQNPVSNDYYDELSKYGNVHFIYGEGEEAHTNTLNSSKIILSCAYQENFGYAVAKAVLAGCIPILPNREVYPEIYDKEFLYDNIESAVGLIKKALIYDKHEKHLDTLLKNQENIGNFSFLPILKDFFF